jgi:hypothetical protein
MESQTTKSINSKLESLLRETADSIGQIAVEEQVPIDFMITRIYQEISNMSVINRDNLGLGLKFGRIKETCYKIIYLALTIIGLVDRITAMINVGGHKSGYPVNWGSNSPLDQFLSEQAQYHFKRMKKRINMFDSIKMFLVELSKTEYLINSKTEKHIREFIFNQFITVGIFNERMTEEMLETVLEANRTNNKHKH